ncbi:Oidioi.mRNA.OKI2018_I69.chr1.g353.t1.cds [Oikopleura dioica]|uniref:Oidioi.mRNA.OKI2018_I69.chr1.g353.t1.cds n=1 Tax=Oikopleura dioica TaxID=34765 RepID=A0ABN7SJK2_OIKDI|nr:Oidioi.mRNA.OKI2018_I69.chr1.g353.t1.cds [Oikopleura dioica]
MKKLLIFLAQMVISQHQQPHFLDLASICQGVNVCPGASIYHPIQKKCVYQKEIIECNAEKITVRVHVQHVFPNLHAAQWKDIRLRIGSCIGKTAPKDGWFEENFSLSDCGTFWSQNETGIVARWTVYGLDKFFLTTGIVLTKSKNFNAECHYDTYVTTMSNSFLVNFSSTPLLVGDTNKLDSLFSMSLWGPKKQITIGERISGKVSTTLNLGTTSYSFQLTKCTVYQKPDKTGYKFDILKDTCNPSSYVGFTSNNSVNGSAHFSFISFAFTATDQNLYLDCGVKLCLINPMTKKFFNQNCIKNCHL